MHKIYNWAIDVLKVAMYYEFEFEFGFNQISWIDLAEFLLGLIQCVLNLDLYLQLDGLNRTIKVPYELNKNLNGYNEVTRRLNAIQYIFKLFIEFYLNLA